MYKTSIYLSNHVINITGNADLFLISTWVSFSPWLHLMQYHLSSLDWNMSNQSSTFQPPYMHSYINKYAVKSIYERANLQRFCMHFCWIVWSKTEKWFYWPAFSKNKGGRIISINHKGKTIHNFVIRHINYNTCDILIVFETN